MNKKSLALSALVAVLGLSLLTGPVEAKRLGSGGMKSGSGGEKCPARHGSYTLPWEDTRTQKFGPWRSLASALAWGARGPGFKSRRPDQNTSVKSFHCNTGLLPRRGRRGRTCEKCE